MAAFSRRDGKCPPSLADTLRADAQCTNVQYADASAAVSVSIPPRQNGIGNAIDLKITKELYEMDINALTPLEALNLIHRWKKLAQSAGKGRKETQQEPSLFD
jgi:hypothetical protein